MESKEATIVLDGAIGPEFDCLPYARQVEEYAGQGVKVLHLRIATVGGDVFNAYPLLSALLNFPGEVHTYIELAASMGGILAMCGTKVHMAKHGLLMLHNPHNGGSGAKNDEFLAKVKHALVNVYATTRNLPYEKISQMFNKTEWLTAEEAKKEGFVDQIYTSRTLSRGQKRQLKNAMVESEEAVYAAFNKILSNEMEENKEPVVDAARNVDAPEATNQNAENAEASTKKSTEHTVKIEFDIFNSVAEHLGKSKEEIFNAFCKLVETSLTATEAPENPSASATDEAFASAQSEAADLRMTIAELQSKLAAFEEKEKLELKNKADNMVANAVTEGKITEESKSTWLEMAYNDYDNVFNLIGTIPARIIDNAGFDVFNSLQEVPKETPANFNEWEKANPNAPRAQWEAAFKRHFGKEYSQMATK